MLASSDAWATTSSLEGAAAWSCSSWSGAPCSALVRRAGSAASCWRGRRCRRPASTRSPPSPWPAGLRRRAGAARQRLPRGLPGRAGARQQPAAAPPGRARLRRLDGAARRGRAVRPARAARLAGAAAAAPCRRRCSIGAAATLPGPAAGGAGVGAAVPDALARAGLPVLGGPARRGARSSSRRSRSPRAWPAPSGSSTSSSCSSSSTRSCRRRRCPGWAGGSAWSRAARRVDVEVETAPLEQLRADLLQLRVAPGSRLHGVYVEELRLPPGAHVTLIVRDGREPRARASTPTSSRGDQVLVVATADVARRRPRPGCGPSPAAASWPAGTASAGTRRRAGPLHPGEHAIRPLTRQEPRRVGLRRSPRCRPPRPPCPAARRRSPVPARHEVLGTPMTGPWPDGAEVALRRHGLLLGRRAHLLAAARRASAPPPATPGGFTPNPTYEETCTGRTGHTEAVQVVYDPAQVDVDVAAQGVLGEPRPDAAQRPGQRPRHAVPHRDLPDHRRRSWRRRRAPRSATRRR